MEFNAKLFKETLSKIIGIIPNKPALPIIENFSMCIKDNKLILMATDLELFIESRLEVNIPDFAGVLLDAKRMKTILETLGDKFFKLKHNPNKKQMILTCGNIEHILQTEPITDFPMPEREEKYSNSFVIDSFVTENIDKVIPFVNTDDLKLNMSGVYFDKGNFVATDGFRLCIVKANSGIDDLLLPLGIVRQLHKFNSPTMSYDGDNILLEDKYMTLYGKLNDVQFPAYKSVIPTEQPPNSLTVNRKAFIEAVKCVIISADKTTRRIILEVNNNKLTISGEDLEFGVSSQDTIDCRCNLDNVICAFNGEYLLTTLGVLNDETVEFRYTSPSSAFIASNSLLNTLLMPVRSDKAEPNPKFAESKKKAEEKAEENVTENEVSESEPVETEIKPKKEKKRKEKKAA